MSTQLGKRKRRKITKDEAFQINGNNFDRERLQRSLQSHFETKFAPLEASTAVAMNGESISESEDQSDGSEDKWEGISDTETPETVEVVTYGAKDEVDRLRERSERRSFMTSKPPAPGAEKASHKKPSKEASNGDDANEVANLKNDMALQRLLQESSLLRNARTDAQGTMPSAVHPSDDPAAASLTLRGTDRHKALDLRLQSLGAKGSLFTQKKMPLNHRLGIVQKQRTREKTRRSEARENGIILEKATTESKQRPRAGIKRDRGIGGPSVGRMKGGTLVLSQKDVRSIQGTDGGKGAMGKGRRRR